jgi:2,4-dienoyl-CoA reductase-like NADH-dependent reductase (Old Yellow Enzyme family)
MNLPLEPLFQPFTFKDVTLRNRFVMSAMTRCFSPGGVPDANVAAYYARRARANVGLIVTEGTGVDHPSSLGSSGSDEKDIPVMHGEAALAGWKRVVDDVHDAGGVIFPQLWHMGPMRQAGTGPHPEAPSSRPSGLWGPSGRTSLPGKYLLQVGSRTAPMSEEEIADVIAAFARSASNARSVGFDGIALHGAHGYLIDAFFWQQTNERTDAFGGDIVRRGRFASDIVRAIRAAVGPRMPILFRFSQWKIQDYDAVLVQSPQELETFLAPLVDAGVDIFDVSARILTRPAFADSPLTIAGWTRKLSGRPVMAVGGVGLTRDLMTSLEGGTGILNNLQPTLDLFLRGEFDLLGSARNLLNDPEWVNKVRAGQPFLPFDPQAYSRLY